MLHRAFDIYWSCHSNCMDDSSVSASRRAIFGALALLVIFFAVLMLSSVGDSATFDEIAHIPAGYSYLKYQDARINPEHPPLIKDLAAAPLLFLNLRFPKDPLFWDIANVNDRQWIAGNTLLYKFGNDPDRILFWSRLPMMLLSVLFGTLIFLWARRTYGTATGLLALFFFVSSPTVIAHSRFVTTDIGAAFGFFVGMITLFYFLRHRTIKSAVVFGVVLGIIQLLKFSLVLMIPISIIASILWILLKKDRNMPNEISRWGRAGKPLASSGFRAKEFSNDVLRPYFAFLCKLFIAGIVALLIIWAVYAFHVWNYPPEQQLADMRYILEGYKVPAVCQAVFGLAG